MNDKIIAVSSCLAGKKCRYDGGTKADPEICRLVRSGSAVCVCPECLGGMTTPRCPSEICGGDGADVLFGNAKVRSQQGQDVTAYFIRGAEETLRILQEAGIQHAVLKARSPSCGSGVIYDGTFTGTVRPGNGVTAALLIKNDIKVETR